MAQTHPQGLYDPAYEHDACGVAFVADIDGRRSHHVVVKGLAALCRLDHRGARGAEPNTGDGAGIMIQVPDDFYRAVVDFPLPPAGRYATGLLFVPGVASGGDEARAVAVLEKYVLVEGARVLGWGGVAVCPEGLGEINTIRGNRNWMAAREALLASPLIPGNLRRLFPVCTPDASDSANFDEVLELLHLAGRSLPHAVLMMIPEAWENDPAMDPARRAFYQFHASLMEPWDGPAAVAFTDGTVIGAVLDRNGLRPGRWWHTADGLVVLASEAGVLDLDPAAVVAKGRLAPGKMFLVDTSAGRIIEDDEIKAGLAAEQPYDDWLHAGLMKLSDLPEREHVLYTHDSVQRRQQTFGYTEEELKILLSPMARTGAEPIGSMGTDTPIAVLSARPRLLYDYFGQLFAQVTNPPLDAIREELVANPGPAIRTE